jgi:hypothetical protein
MGVVPSLDELEDRHARLGLGVETAAVEQSHSSVAKKLSHMASQFCVTTKLPAKSNRATAPQQEKCTR